MPRHDVEYVPAPKRQVVPCRDCGRGLEVGWRRKLPKLCTDCACERQADAARQINAGAGPIAEKRARGYAAYAARILGGGESLTSLFPNAVSLCSHHSIPATLEYVRWRAGG